MLPELIPLKECPHCGEEAKFSVYPHGMPPKYEVMYGHGVSCGSCSATTTSFFSEEKNNDHALSEAARVWNQRFRKGGPYFIWNDKAQRYLPQPNDAMTSEELFQEALKQGSLSRQEKV